MTEGRPAADRLPGARKRQVVEPGDRLRLFLAIDFPRELKESLVEATASLRAPGHRDIHWVPAESVHLTLKFLGPVIPDAAADLSAAANRAAMETAPFQVVLHRWDLFENRTGTGVFYAAVQTPAPVARLAGDLDRALESLGYERERRPFRAHVTPARIRSATALSLMRRGIRRLGPVPAMPFVADAAVLFSSETGHSGPVYTPLARLPLSGER